MKFSEAYNLSFAYSRFRAVFREAFLLNVREILLNESFYLSQFLEAYLAGCDGQTNGRVN